MSSSSNGKSWIFFHIILQVRASSNRVYGSRNRKIHITISNGTSFSRAKQLSASDCSEELVSVPIFSSALFSIFKYSRCRETLHSSNRRYLHPLPPINPRSPRNPVECRFFSHTFPRKPAF